MSPTLKPVACENANCTVWPRHLNLTPPATPATPARPPRATCRALLFVPLLLQIELHRHLTGSLPCDSVRSVLEQISPDIADDAMLETPEVAGDTEEEQASAWALLTKQCHAVKVATTANDNLKMLFAKAIADLERDNVM